MQVSLSLCHSLSANNRFLCVSGLWPVCTRKEVGHGRRGLRFSSVTRVTCQLMWPRLRCEQVWQEPNVFIYLRGIYTLHSSLAGGGRPTCRDSRAWDCGLRGRGSPDNMCIRSTERKRQLQLFTATPPPKPENVLHYTSVLRMCCETCSRCLMSVRCAGQQGVAVLLRLTSTRLFLAEDLLTAHLTL